MVQGTKGKKTGFYHVEYETTKTQMEIRKDVQTINRRIP